MSPQREALDRLVQARALLQMGEAAHRAAVDAAVDGLMAGLDNEPLRELAGLPPTTTSFELEQLLDKTLVAFDPGYSPMSDSDAAILAARSYAMRYLEGSLSARQLSSWAHARIGHDGALAVQPIVMLDDDLDLEDSVVVRQPVDSEAVIRQYLASTASVADRLRVQPEI